jgi:hypothetical protein
MGWDAVVRGIHDVLASDQGRADQAVQIAELIRRAGSYRWVGLYAVTEQEIAAVGWNGGRHAGCGERRTGRLHRRRPPCAGAVRRRALRPGCRLQAVVAAGAVVTGGGEVTPSVGSAGAS